MTSWVIGRERVRLLRMQRHLLVAVAATVACVLLAPASDTLAGFAVLPVPVYVALTSAARALDARLGYLWGWLYGEPVHTTRFDEVAHRVIQSLLRHDSAGNPAMPKVRPIDPEIR